jgi:hypothetical protein
MTSATQGVALGCERSLAVANDVLYYLSRSGVVAYSGGIPQHIGFAFGTDRFCDAVGGSDGLKYYVSMRRQGADDEWLMYVYDSLRNVWHIEDDVRADYFTLWRGDLYFLNSFGEIWCMILHSDELTVDVVLEPCVEWCAEFADMVDNAPNRKGMSKLQVRLRLEPGASVELYIKYDSEDGWRRIRGIMSPGRKRSYYLPVIPRRADHYRLKLTGTGGCEVYSLVRERYVGSELTNETGGF